MEVIRYPDGIDTEEEWSQSWEGKDHDVGISLIHLSTTKAAQRAAIGPSSPTTARPGPVLQAPPGAVKRRAEVSRWCHRPLISRSLGR